MYYIGIDMGGSHISAGLVDDNGILIRKMTSENHISSTYQDFVTDMVVLCKKLVKLEDIDLSKINSVGIGLPGTPDNVNGTMNCISSTKYNNAPIRDEFQKYLNIKVILENDANCAALAEAYAGAAKGTHSSVTVTLGTGVGGGIIINNKIFSGFNNAGSELGHSIIVSNGEQCPCGRKGCWEAYSSATALVRDVKRALNTEEGKNSLIIQMVNGDFDKINGLAIFEAAKSGDQICINVIEKYINYLAEGIANIVNVLMPEVVVLAGGISQQGEVLLDMLRSKYYEYIYTKNEPRTKIRIAELGVDAGIIGAAMLGKNQ